MAYSKAARTIALPEQYSRRKLNSLYRAIPVTDSHFRLLRKYFNAMANLYGVIPLWKAFEIIQTQNPGKFSETVLLSFADVARHEEEDYYLLGEEEIYANASPSAPLDREIIDIFQLSTVTGAYEETRNLQSGKPYYIPPKKELLCYDDMTYCEPTPEYEQFMGFIRSKTTLDNDKERFIFSNILLKLRVVSMPVGDVITELGQVGIQLGGIDEANRFAYLFANFSNNFRMHCNRGHTPNELAALYGIPGGTSMTLSMLKKKIGRNDPCPCGSGRKYKKCCGR